MTGKRSVGFLLLFVLMILVTGCQSTPSPATSGTEQTSEKKNTYDLPPHEFIRTGMNVERVRSLVGAPRKTVPKSNDLRVLHYPFGVVIVEGNTVRYKHPPSKVSKKQGDVEPGAKTGSNESVERK